MGLRDRMREAKKMEGAKEAKPSKAGQGGSSNRSIIKLDALPEGRGLWNPPKEEHIIDVIPYLAGTNHPDFEEGTVVEDLDVLVYKSTNPHFVSTFKMWDIMDPIQQWIMDQPYRIPTEVFKEVATKRMTIYQIWSHFSPEEEEKGIQLWYVPWFFMKKHLDKLKTKPRGGGVDIRFWDVDTGMSIAFEIAVSGKFTNAEGREGDSIEYSGHRFIPRDEPLPDWIVEQSMSLDMICNMRPEWEEVEKAFLRTSMKYNSKGGDKESGSGSSGSSPPPASKEAPPPASSHDETKTEEYKSESTPEPETKAAQDRKPIRRGLSRRNR